MFTPWRRKLQPLGRILPRVVLGQSGNFHRLCQREGTSVDVEVSNGMKLNALWPTDCHLDRKGPLCAMVWSLAFMLWLMAPHGGHWTSDTPGLSTFCISPSLLCVGRGGTSGRGQREGPMGGTSGKDQWAGPAGGRWEGPMEGASGRGQWEGPVGGANGRGVQEEGGAHSAVVLLGPLSADLSRAEWVHPGPRAAVGSAPRGMLCSCEGSWPFSRAARVWADPPAPLGSGGIAGKRGCTSANS